MKHSISKRYHLAISILLGLILLETLLLWIIISRKTDLATMVNDLQTTLIVSVLAIFVCGVVIYNLIPVMLRKSLSRTAKIVSEIAHGNYEVNIDGELAAHAGDRDIDQDFGDYH